MAEKQRFATVLNSQEHTRFFVIDYFTETVKVNIFDFVHTADVSDCRHAVVEIKIRLQDSWNAILQSAGFSTIEFFGNWEGDVYDTKTSQRLIIVAR